MTDQLSDGQKENQLVRKVLNGDEYALQILYEAYADALFAFILHALEGEQGEAEDIWQETWIAAIDSLDRFHGRSRFFTWLCAIARHKTADYFRYKQRKNKVLERIEMQENPDFFTGGPLPEDLVQAKVTKLSVIHALKSLPADYQYALEQRYLHGEGIEKIASLLRRSYKATESLMSRARKRFQEMFLKEIGGKNE